MSSKRGKNGRNKTYCSDQKLPPRIKEYLSAATSSPSIDELVYALQMSYPEYKRRKYHAFTEQVTKVYQKIVDNLEPAEMNHLIRKGAESGESASDDFIDMTTDSEIELTQAKGNNDMNNLLVQVYSSKPHLPNESENGVAMEMANQTDPRPLDGGAAVGKKRKSDDREGRKVLKKKKKPSLDEDTANILKEKHIHDIPLVYPETRFTDIGGCDALLKDICELLLDLQHPEVFKHLGIQSPRGVLLHGPPGCGKTLLGHAIAGEIGWPLIRLAATELVSGVSGETEEKLRGVFQRAKEHSPCVVLLDDIDSISPKRETAQREMEKRIVTQIGCSLDDLHSLPVLIIGTTNRIDSIDPSLRRAGRFDKEISLGIPNEVSRKHILEVLCCKLKVDKGLNYSTLAHLTPGFVGADLSALVREASLSSVNRLLLNKSCDSHMTLADLSQLLKEQSPLSEEQLDSLSITESDFRVGLQCVQPSSKREGFATVPDVTWDDVGALESVRSELSLAILAPVRYPEHFLALGLKQPPGVLLAGPPGCGKTLLAKAIANESGINFISVKGPELLNMYVGESERAVRQVFQRAKNSAPCVIFFDEIDALCPRRSDIAETSASSRVVNQVLTEMDGMETRRQVFVVGATNRPDMIDPAILRPGRLDKVLYVGLPTADERVDILKAITKDGTCPLIAGDVSLSSIAHDRRSEGYSGADLAALVRESATLALKEILSLSLSSLSSCNQEQVASVAPVYVSMKHFNEAFSRVTPSVKGEE